MKKFLFLILFILPLSVNAQGLDSAKIIKLINQDRIEAGLKPLSENKLLDKSSCLKAQDEIKLGYFAHTSPKGFRFSYWLREVGYRYRYAGENLARRFTTEEAINAAFLKSPTHKANILEKEWSEIGVCVLGDNVVVHFGKR